MVIFASAVLLTVGVFSYNDFESKAKATEQSAPLKNENKIVPEKYIEDNKIKTFINPSSQRQSEGEKQRLSTDKGIEKEQSPVNQPPKKSEMKPASAQPEENKSETQHKNVQAQTNMPDTKVIDGYTYVNLMDRADENLMDLVSIAKKHDATLYAIEFSDCFAMFDNTSNEAIMLFSTGSRSVSIEKVDILYDMHPSIKKQIQGVVETGEETVVKIGEHESYHIKKDGGNIIISF